MDYDGYDPSPPRRKRGMLPLSPIAHILIILQQFEIQQYHFQELV